LGKIRASKEIKGEHMQETKFSKLGISEEVVKAIEKMGFDTPSKIQAEAIPVILTGKDVIAQAQTGTGKTLVFGSALLSNIQKSKNVQAVILTPTRELAVQIEEELQRLSAFSKVRITTVYGGVDIEKQIKVIRNGVEIVIGTPGRVIDLIKRRVLHIDHISYFVLDEADEMLNMGFLEDIEFIFEKTNDYKQTMLFSATMPKPIKDIAKNYLKSDLEIVTIKEKSATATTVQQYYFEILHKQRLEVICRIIDSREMNSVMIFCRTKRGVDELSEELISRGYLVEGMHGDLSQAVRMNTLRKFKEGKINFLIATDVAARGIDVENVSHVVNYDLPQEIESYIHRIGRTGRANKEGTAYSLVTSREISFLKQVERKTNSTIKKLELPTMNEIFEAKSNKLFAEVENIVANKENQSFLHLFKGCDNETLLNAASALFALQYKNELGYDYKEDKLKSATPSKNIRRNKENTMRLFLTAGSMDNIKVNQIVRFLVEEGKAKKEDLGEIVIKRKFTFVDVRKDSATRLISNANNKKLNNRRVAIEIANTK